MTPLADGLVTGIATAFGAVIPIVPFLSLPAGTAIWVSLTVIIVTLTITTVASLVKSRYDQDRLATDDAEGEESGSDPGAVGRRDRLDGQSD